MDESQSDAANVHAGAASSTLRFALVSISKLLPGRLTSGWAAWAGPAATTAVSTSAAAPLMAKTRPRRRRGGGPSGGQSSVSERGLMNKGIVASGCSQFVRFG